jgi:23S rRNA (uracil1939-C5)-methyltransferase
MKLHIEKAIYGGSGLARHEGKAVFVPFTLPGEEVEAHIVKDSGAYAEADLDTILEPSPARTTAPCMYFGKCGGCHYQHSLYQQQLQIKTGILRETLERSRISDIPEISTLSAEPFAYRNRIRLHLQRSPFALCYKRRAAHANLPVQTCPIAAPLLQSAIETLTRIGPEVNLAAWADEIELFTNAEENALLLSLWTSRSAREATELLQRAWSALQTHLPQLTGAAVFTSERGKQTGRRIAALGETSLTYRAAAREYRVTLGSFFQINRFLLDRIVALVTHQHNGQRAWDLYSGVGLFTLPLSERFSEVTAVESSASSIHDLRHNLRHTGTTETTHRIVASDTAAFLRTAAKRRATAPDLVVVDPPRAGLGREVTTLLGEIRPAHITYVSCDPATLARDLRALIESGYHLRTMHLVDMFPNTFHLESVTQLSLR